MGSIDTITGMGVKQATTLRKNRVRTTEALLKRAGSRSGRRELAGATGLPAPLLLKWVNRADLMRVTGIGEEYSDLLEEAGVDTVKELRNRNPENLVARMAELNRSRRLVRRLPTLPMVERWVAQAGELPPLISH
jgi:predicted flap endonuclease-1-like 5' DNA nuclease